MRLWLRAGRVAAGLMACLPGHAIARARGRSSPQVRRFLDRAGRSFGLRVRVEGVPLDRNVLFVANHVSWLDILALGGATGAAFVSKDDVARWPVVGWLARQAGTLFVERASRADVKGQAEALGEALGAGRPVALFPEGTTSDGTRLLPFRASLLAAVEAVPDRVRVQPVAIDYGAAACEIAWTDNESTDGNVRRVGGRAGVLPVTLRFLPPVDPSITGRKAIAAAARAAIAAALSASGTIPAEAISQGAQNPL